MKQDAVSPFCEISNVNLMSLRGVKLTIELTIQEIDNFSQVMFLKLCLLNNTYLILSQSLNYSDLTTLDRSICVKVFFKLYRRNK